ncbi:MAG: hypothetical protein ACKO37_09965 [Vampirovibrionales bacterium]
MQRYYILSTLDIVESDKKAVSKLVETIRNEHGCELIINGVLPSLKYYLRLINNTNDFINYYCHNLAEHSEIQYEQKLAWNTLLTRTKESPTP